MTADWLPALRRGARVYGRTAAAAWRCFGAAGRDSWFWTLGLPPLLLFTWLTLLLDRLFFPAFRRVPVSRPVFLVGHPRSGTTLLHRLLHATGDYAAFRVRDLLLPALTARRLVFPLLDLLLRRRTAGHDAAGGHAAGPDSVEEEELLFLPLLDTQFLSFQSPLGLHPRGFAELVEGDGPEDMRAEARGRHHAGVRFLEACFRRQIYATGRSRIVAKMNYSLLRLRTLLARFPDAHFVCILRSPYQTIPSQLSLHRAILLQRWPGLDARRPDLLLGYYRRRYQASLALYRHMDGLIRSGGIPADRLLLLTYESLTGDLAGAVEKITAFTGLPVSPALRAHIAQAAAAQQHYARPHRNARLADFGLSEADITRDLADFNARHGFTPEGEKAAPAAGRNGGAGA